MEPCAGCGFRNAPDRDTCAKCGRVFRDSRRPGGLKSALVALLALAFLAVGVAAVLALFSPEGRPVPTAATPEASPPPPMAPPVPVQPPTLPESPARKKGEEFLRQADRLYAQGDYPGAAAAYQEARFFGALEGEAIGRKEVAEWVVQLRDIRDYLARETYLEPPPITVGHHNLTRMDPARLPSDAWRETHRKTLARLEELLPAINLPGARQVEPRPPPK